MFQERVGIYFNPSFSEEIEQALNQKEITILGWGSGKGQTTVFRIPFSQAETALVVIQKFDPKAYLDPETEEKKASPEEPQQMNLF